MFAAYVLIVLTTLTHLSGTTCFKFYVTRDLNSFQELEKTKWIGVEVVRSNLLEDGADGNVNVKFNIHESLPYSDVLAFFANDAKEILQVNLKQTIESKLYASPYKFKKELKGENTTQIKNEGFYQISGNFPTSWLPENSTKISAAVVGPNGQYYNLYKIQNFKISLPDLMVVEEYKPGKI